MRPFRLAVTLCLTLAGAAPADDASERIGDAWHDPRNPIVRIFEGERLDLWSLRPVQRVEPPAAIDDSTVRNPIDRFLPARREEADRRTLLRRVTYDLTGLPPTPEALDRFLADERPDAWERVVDELLASPRHGEHVARMWLDVVRYSDSNGFDWDEFRPQAWRFRDYVIRSLNADKPYDRFLVEQLAGDELFNGPPRTPEERDALIATGFLRIGPQDNSAPLFNEQPRARAELMADLVETTGSAMLGLTLSCCRCHDHKYDPLSQADHFRLRAFFEPVAHADDLPLDLAAEQDAIREHNARLDAELARLRAERERLVTVATARHRAASAVSLPQPVEAPKQVSELSGDLILAALEVGDRARFEQLETTIKEAEQSRRTFTTGLLMTDAPGEVPPTHVLAQGDHRAPAEVVPAGFLSALDPNPATIVAPAKKESHGRRLTLARWIASEGNPLTARVIVNRIWQMHFGRGLVETPNDFGLGGAAPTHPELLDWLAADFMEGGWSLKRLHRRIVTSAAYREAAFGEDVVAGRELRRLSAEQLRDSLLFVSGLMTDKAQGPPVWPELPADILQANPALLDDNETKTKGWYPSPPHERNARSVFLVQKRTVRVPLLETFDLPENATSCGRRDVSTVAPQALSLLNSPLAIEAARAFAARVERESPIAPTDQVQLAFALALQREPTSDELAACLKHLDRRGLPDLCRVLLNLNEFVYLD